MPELTQLCSVGWPGAVAHPGACYIAILTQGAQTVVFTAAPPGQGGADHVNEQPPSYWIEKFSKRGFAHNAALTQRWQTLWEATDEIESWYHKNLMVFQRVVQSGGEAIRRPDVTS